MMMRNYGEATKLFVNCLLFIQRTKSLQVQQQQKKNFQYDVVSFIENLKGDLDSCPGRFVIETNISLFWKEVVRATLD